jgi:two-component system sensor histidine kinase YesM
VFHPGGDWDLSYLISEKQILSQVSSGLNSGLLPLFLVIIFIVVILILMIRSVNTGISRIVTDINSLEYSRGLQYRIDRPRLKEIEMISRSVGKMLERIDHSFQREQEAKFAAYRSQINPHFFFNTLECVRSMAHRKKDGDMETIISSMASMFRYSLFARRLVPLSQELDHVRNFITVMNISRGRVSPDETAGKPKYTLEIEAGERARGFPVLSMILQPLVENAVFHGFVNTTDRDNRIKIQAACDGETGDLTISVTDNGEGMTEEETAALNRRIQKPEDDETAMEGQDAISNIWRRMCFYLGTGFSMIVFSKKDSYTRLELRIPRTEAETCTG